MLAVQVGVLMRRVPLPVTRSDYIVRAGEIGQCMFFIRTGACLVLLPIPADELSPSDSKIVVGRHGERFANVKTLESGDYFGEVRPCCTVVCVCAFSCPHPL